MKIDHKEKYCRSILFQLLIVLAAVATLWVFINEEKVSVMLQAMLDSSMSASIADEYGRVNKAIDESLELLYRVSQQKEYGYRISKGFIAENYRWII